MECSRQKCSGSELSTFILTTERKNLLMKNISIPQPCSEDFSLMTPTERGTFCEKCATDTFDFTGKTSTEIKLILKNQVGQKVCGKFTSGQLEALNLEFEQWSFRSVKSFQSMFLYCLIAVFGLSLFSCSNPQGIAEIRSTKCWGLPKIDSIIDEPMTIQPVAKPALPDSCVEILGYIEGSDKYQQMLTETPEEEKADPIQEEITSLDGTLYPNPTINSTNVELRIPDSDYYVLDLFNMAGQHISNVHDGKLESGIFQTQISLFGQPPGMYLLVVRSSSLSKTFRIEKL